MGKEKRGIYIVFEGVVACGKTTQSRLLAQDLQARNPDRPVVWTREPGGSEIADAIRDVVQVRRFQEEMTSECEQYLYAASRAQTLRKIVWPALDRDEVVVSDRSYLTSVSFQGFGRGLGYDTVMAVNHVAIGNRNPDRVVFLDVDLDTALSRARDKAGDKFEEMDRSFFERARSGYLYSAQRDSETFRVVDGNAGIDTVRRRIAQALAGLV